MDVEKLTVLDLVNLVSRCSTRKSLPWEVALAKPAKAKLAYVYLFALAMDLEPGPMRDRLFLFAEELDKWRRERGE